MKASTVLKLAAIESARHSDPESLDVSVGNRKAIKKEVLRMHYKFTEKLMYALCPNLVLPTPLAKDVTVQKVYPSIEDETRDSKFHLIMTVHDLNDCEQRLELVIRVQDTEVVGLKLEHLPDRPEIDLYPMFVASPHITPREGLGKFNKGIKRTTVYAQTNKPHTVAAAVIMSLVSDYWCDYSLNLLTAVVTA